MALRPGDHPALVFLYRELLPFMIAGRKVRRQLFVWLDGVYRYVGDLMAALSGLGLGGPVVGAIAHPERDSDDLWTKLTDQLGPRWVYAGIAAIVVWLILRLVIQNERVSQRAMFARQFALDNEFALDDLNEGLRSRAPRDAILRAFQSTRGRVQTAMNREIWPFPTFRPPPEAFQVELDREIDRIREERMANWDPLQPGQEF